MSAYSYFPGCSLTSTAIEYDISFRAVAGRLGIDLHTVKDWNCCGASPAPHHWGGAMGVFLPARNLHIAAQEKSQAMVAPCAGCFTRHKYAQYQLSQSAELRQKVGSALGEPVLFDTEVLNVIQLLEREAGAEGIKKMSGGRLAGINFGAYYGCVLTRPAEVLNFDNPKDPVSMEPLLKATGANLPHFPFKTDCCGSYMSITRKEIVLNASRRIIETAVESGIDALVTACPLCHQNLDLRQRQINKAFDTSYEMPVLYLSQAIGLGLGISPDDLGIGSHAVSAAGLIKKMDAAAAHVATAAIKSDAATMHSDAAAAMTAKAGAQT